MDIERSLPKYDITLTNYTLIDGLTPDIIKRKYIWLLNAIVNNAIIGQDEYGLVWYSGDWLAGEWEDGSWHSGIWYDGEWKNGKFYSYKYDTKQLLQRNKRILEKDNPVYSQFRNGIWRRGEFYNGYFGTEKYNEVWDMMAGSSGLPTVEIIFYHTRWERGDFYNGVFRNATWHDGMFYNGIFFNSQWLKGSFIGGTFQGSDWWNGNFTGGDFILGNWWNGKFNQSNPKIKSRFGSFPLSGRSLAESNVFWYNGEFINGEFHSGLNIVNGKTQPSIDHTRTIWKNGKWYNGLWYGGTHIDGDFNNGFWFEGFWIYGIFNNGYWLNGFWSGGTLNDGFFVNGVFLSGDFKGGKYGYELPSYFLENELSKRETLTMLPKYLGFVPSVITYPATGITYYSAICGGNVIADEQSVTSRGVCWGTEYYPTLSNYYTVDGTGLGAFGSYLENLSEGTFYYVRAYATNASGTAYGNQVEFSTLYLP